jgi:hypothetical protein
LHRLGGGPAIGEVDEDEEARAPFDERADRGPVPGTLDAIALPVPRLDTVVDLGRPVGDHRHPDQAATALLSLQLAAPTTSTPLGRAAHWCVGVVDGLVDRLGAQLVLGLVEEPHPQLVGYLLGAPSLAEQLLHSGAELLVEEDPPLAGPGDSFLGAAVRSMGLVPAGGVGVAV